MVLLQLQKAHNCLGVVLVDAEHGFPQFFLQLLDPSYHLSQLNLVLLNVCQGLLEFDVFPLNFYDGRW